MEGLISFVRQMYSSEKTTDFSPHFIFAFMTFLFHCENKTMSTLYCICKNLFLCDRNYTVKIFLRKSAENGCLFISLRTICFLVLRERKHLLHQAQW